MSARGAYFSICLLIIKPAIKPIAITITKPIR
ncbi:MAG: hypothetical protein ACJAXX_000193, partial [Roseivirga sp.]